MRADALADQKKIGVMRQSQKSNRSRGRGSRKGGGGGNNLNRVYDSAGPEGKVRGTPQQIIDKYLTLARDAQTSGDRVAAENFLQHAEHYQRILISAMSEQEKARREAAAQATDDPGDEQPAAMDVADPNASQGEQPREQNRRRKPPASDIEGMTTTDAGAAEPETLVVATEESESAQPKPNGNGATRRPRRRAPKPTDDVAAQPKAEDDPAPSPAAETADG